MTRSEIRPDHRWPAYVSPNTGLPLQMQEDRLCGSDEEVFPIRSGIPYFVEGDEYVANFGVQWNRFLKTQLDSYTGLPLSRDRIRRCMGEALWSELAGRTVLEVGCGAGRFTEVLLNQGALVTSVDLSRAVEANAKNCPIGSNHRIAKADVMHLPFAPKQFDVVMCLGVIQHTPDSEATIAKLYDQVRSGGWLVIDHYTHERSGRGSLKPLFRSHLKHMPPGQTLPAVERMVETFLPWHRRFRNLYPAWFLLCRVSPLVTYYRSIPQLSGQLQKEWATLDTHDSLTDWFKHLRSKEKIAGHLNHLGLDRVWCEKSGNGIEARGRRPAAPIAS